MESLWNYVTTKYEDLKTGVDPEVDKWFLMKEPGPIVLIIISYASFVLFIGPWFMKNRPPFQIKKIIIVYNAFQVFMSAYIVTLMFDTKYFVEYLFGFGCTSISEAEDAHFKQGLWRGIWVYTMVKIIDLIDTCFFVLRKKYSNITFLHVYHHIGVTFFSWCILKYAVGQESLVVGILNSAVHVMMYTYYLLSSLGPRFKKFLWWKKYMTRIQLAQFGYIFVHMLASIWLSCRWNKVVVYGIMFNSIIHIALFMDFYRKAYNKEHKVIKANGHKED